MNGQISNWVVAVILISSFVLVGLSLKVGYDKGWSNKPPVYIDREVIKEVVKVEYRYYPVSSPNITAEEVLAILAEFKQNHLDWATRPDLIARQDEKTGDTAFNLMIVDKYTSIENFVMWEANDTK